MVRKFLLDNKHKLVVVFFLVLVGMVYFFANPHFSYYYDYTYRIAEAFLHGRIGLVEQAPSYLNEMVPFNGMYYSVFPLGSVVTMLPLALLKVQGIIKDFPAAMLASLIAAGCFIFCFGLTGLRNLDFKKRLLLSLCPVFGTWTLTNLTFGGAWQIALGFGLVGQLAALYFILVKKNYFLAGIFFALAFGNRTELAILVFIFLGLIYLQDKKEGQLFNIKSYFKFLAVPAALLGFTLIYNYLRFGSLLDFGYARIPGVLEEPWYRHGIFSIYAIPLNFYAMLIQGWRFVPNFPFFIPNGFGGSILLSSPFLFLLFRGGGKNKKLALLSWISILVLTLTLFLHGNPGGWQFSYRYAMVMIPWFFLILVDNSPRKIAWSEAVLFLTAVLVNFWATYLFNWTEYVA